MINEQITIKEEYFDLARSLVEELEKSSLLTQEKIVVGVCGESGSGKSVTAKCLKVQLEKQNVHSVILHADSYFKLPPKENHEKRKSDIKWVGPGEVKMELLQSHIQQFKAHEKNLTIPVVDYEKNIFSQHHLEIGDVSILVVEGVYSFLLDQLDFKVFLERTYRDTLGKRKKRKREVYDPFVERVLAIEHSIVLPFKKMANVVVKKDYTLSVP